MAASLKWAHDSVFQCKIQINYNSVIIKLERTIIRGEKEREKKREMREVTFSISCGNLGRATMYREKVSSYLYPFEKKKKKKTYDNPDMHRARFIASDKSRETEVSILFNFMQLAFLEKD